MDSLNEVRGVNGFCIARVALVAACVVSLSPLNAETFVLKRAPSSLADWKDGSFYDNGGKAPTGAATDVISIMPSVPRVEINGSQSDVISFLGDISRIICNFSST